MKETDLMSKWVDLIKEKSQRVQTANNELLRRLEPQVKEFKDTLQNSIKNSTIVTGFSTTKWFSTETQDMLSEASPKARNRYQSLLPLIGQTLFTSEPMTLTQADVQAFADVTHDQQWIHVNPERAKKQSPYRGTVVHGLYIVSLIPGMRKLEDDENYQGGRFVVNAGFDQVDFLSPLKPGQPFRLRAELQQVSLGKRHVDVSETIQIESACGKRVICKAITKFKLYL